MKIARQDFDDKLIGAEKEMSFGIDSDSPIIFEILRDKMYSNKIGSICREVASNSRDANREAGRADSPIEITISHGNDELSMGDTYIGFRDFGLGISPDRMENVFIRYASSTKRGTDSQTGGFGLGAKTPFAYTDTFTIITVCYVGDKKMKYIYTAMIDSSRKGKMILFDSEETDEETGTQILIPILHKDIYTFEKECHYTTYLWDTPVQFRGFANFSNKKPKLLSSLGENVFLYKEWNGPFSSENNVYVSIDRILYPLNSEYFPALSNKSFKSGGATLVLEYETGELSVSANREAIQYDQMSIERIQATVDLMKEEVLSLFSNLLETDGYNIIKRKSFHKIVKRDYDTSWGTKMKLTQNDVFIANNIGAAKLIDYETYLDLVSNYIDPKSLGSNVKLNHYNVSLLTYGGGYGNQDYTLKNLDSDEIFKKLELNNVESYIVDSVRSSERNNNILKLLPTSNREALLFTPKVGYKDADSHLDTINEFNTLVHCYDINFKFYSDVEVEEKKGARGTGGRGKKDSDSGTISIPYRMIGADISNGIMEVNSKTGEIESGLVHGGNPVLFISIDQISSITTTNPSVYRGTVDKNFSLNKIILDYYFREFLQTSRYKIIVIGKRSEARLTDPIFQNYFEVIENVKVSHKKEIERAFIQMRINEITRDFVDEKWMEVVAPLLPKSSNFAYLYSKLQKKGKIKGKALSEEFKNLYYYDNISKVLEIKFNFEGLEKNLEKRLAKHPIITRSINDRWSGNSKNKTLLTQIKKYINNL